MIYLANSHQQSRDPRSGDVSSSPSLAWQKEGLGGVASVLPAHSYVRLIYLYRKKKKIFSGCGTDSWVGSPQPMMPCCALLCSCYKGYMEKEKEMCCRMFAPLKSSSAWPQIKVIKLWKRVGSPKTSVVSEPFSGGEPASLLYGRILESKCKVMGVCEGERAGCWGETLLHVRLGASLFWGKLAWDRNLKLAALE